MKWLFLLLLIINIAIFAWGYQHEQMEQQPAVEAGADVGNMRLISEIAEEEKQKSAGTSEQADAEVVIAKADQPEPEHTSATQEKEDKEESEGVVVEAESEAKVEERVAEKDEESKPEKVVAKVESEMETEEKTADKEGKGEKEKEPKVASTDTKTEKSAQEKQPEEPKKPEKKPVTVMKCGIVGPLKDRKVAKGIMDDLRKAEIDAKLERKIDKEQIGYWVVIPPMEDGSQAQAKIDELAQVGLKDIWHFRGGGMKNAISLGMFAKKENADNFSKEVLAKGFKTEMRPRYLNKTRYLVKFTIAKPKVVTENMWQDVKKKYSKMPFREQKCD
jgi:hypothetical protein